MKFDPENMLSLSLSAVLNLNKATDTCMTCNISQQHRMKFLNRLSFIHDLRSRLVLNIPTWCHCIWLLYVNIPSCNTHTCSATSVLLRFLQFSCIAEGKSFSAIKFIREKSIICLNIFLSPPFRAICVKKHFSSLLSRGHDTRDFLSGVKKRNNIAQAHRDDGKLIRYFTVV